MVAIFNKKYFKLEHFLPPKVTPDAVALQDNVRPVFGGSQVDSARQNLASSFVNGFVNAGFGQVLETLFLIVLFRPRLKVLSVGAEISQRHNLLFIVPMVTHGNQIVAKFGPLRQERGRG